MNSVGGSWCRDTSLTAVSAALSRSLPKLCNCSRLAKSSPEDSSRGSAAAPATPAEAGAVASSGAGAGSGAAACTFCKTDITKEEDVKALMEHIRSM